MRGALLQGGDVDDSEDPNLAVITTKQIQCDLAAAEATVAAWELGHHTPAPLTADEIREALDHAGRVISTVDPQARHNAQIGERFTAMVTRRISSLRPGSLLRR